MPERLLLRLETDIVHRTEDGSKVDSVHALNGITRICENILQLLLSKNKGKDKHPLKASFKESVIEIVMDVGENDNMTLFSDDEAAHLANNFHALVQQTQAYIDAKRNGDDTVATRLQAESKNHVVRVAHELKGLSTAVRYRIEGSNAAGQLTKNDVKIPTTKDETHEFEASCEVLCVEYSRSFTVYLKAGKQKMQLQATQEQADALRLLPEKGMGIRATIQQTQYHQSKGVLGYLVDFTEIAQQEAELIDLF